MLEEDILQFKKALQTAKTVPNIDNFTQDAITIREIITQKTLNLMQKNISSQ